MVETLPAEKLIIKLSQQNFPRYALSEKFSIYNPQEFESIKLLIVNASTLRLNP